MRGNFFDIDSELRIVGVVLRDIDVGFSATFFCKFFLITVVDSLLTQVRGEACFAVNVVLRALQSFGTPYRVLPFGGPDDQDPLFLP